MIKIIYYLSKFFKQLFSYHIDSEENIILAILCHSWDIYV